MSIRLPYGENQTRSRHYRPTRPFMPRQQTTAPPKNKSETVAPQPKYYVDSFSSNFADKPSSNNHDTNKPKTKHVTFQEPQRTKFVMTVQMSYLISIYSSESSRIDFDNNNMFPSSSFSPNVAYYSPQYSRSPMSTYSHSHSPYRYNHPNNHYYYPSEEFYPQYPYMMVNPQYMPRPRGMIMSAPPVWT